MDFATQIYSPAMRFAGADKRAVVNTADVADAVTVAGVHDLDASTTAASAAGPFTGAVVDDRYRLSRMLGRGASAAVYYGIDTRLGRTVAVKIFHPAALDSRAVARQHTEMVSLARLNHPNLVSIFDARVAMCPEKPAEFGGQGGSGGAVLSYLVMEFVDGETLTDRLSAGASVLESVAEIGFSVATALAVVHEHRMVHRDVKPANILLPAAGGAKLTDFGIARLLGSARLTSSAEVVGTPLYLSPEQARGVEVGPASDIYSLGLVLLECLTGRTEFPGDPVHSVMTRLGRDPCIPGALPAPWPDLLRAMTSAAPAERPTADDVATALAGYLANRAIARSAQTNITPDLTAELNARLGGGTSSVREVPEPAARSPGQGRHRLLAVLTGGIALAITAASIGVLAWDRPDSRPNPASPAPTPQVISVQPTLPVMTDAVRRQGSRTGNAGLPEEVGSTATKTPAATESFVGSTFPDDPATDGPTTGTTEPASSAPVTTVPATSNTATTNTESTGGATVSGSTTDPTAPTGTSSSNGTTSTSGSAATTQAETPGTSSTGTASTSTAPTGATG